MFENRDDNQEQKSEVRQRMEAFYAAMSKDPDLLAFFTGMAASVSAENKGEETKE